MDVDQRLARVGNAEERIGLRGDLADTRADRQHQVGLAHAGDEARRRAGAEIAAIGSEPVVDDVLAAERAAGRDIAGLEKLGDVGAGGVGPA